MKGKAQVVIFGSGSALKKYQQVQASKFLRRLVATRLLCQAFEKRLDLSVGCSSSRKSFANLCGSPFCGTSLYLIKGRLYKMLVVCEARDSKCFFVGLRLRN